MRLLCWVMLILGLCLGLMVGVVAELRRMPSEAMSILFSTYDGDMEFYQLSPETLHIHQITDNQFLDTQPIWSPTGQWIVFLTVMDGDGDLFRMRPNGSHRQQLTLNDIEDWEHTFSPDGQWIAFTSYLDGDSEIFRMRVDGSGYEQLTHNHLTDVQPRWSADGRSIFFKTQHGDSSTYAYRMWADGSDIERLTRVDLTGTILIESPDNEQLFFVQYNYPNGFYRLTFDDSEPELMALASISHLPQLSPDGEWFVYTGFSSGGDSEIYRIRTDGTDLQQLTDNSGEIEDGSPSWSADGKWILFSSNRDGDLELFRMRPDGSSVQQLTHNQVEEHEATFSPLIDMPLNKGALMVVSVILMGIGGYLMLRRLDG